MRMWECKILKQTNYGAVIRLNDDLPYTSFKNIEISGVEKSNRIKL